MTAMDDEQYAAARERLERDYISRAIDAEEYTRLRRQLEGRPSVPDHDPEPEPEPEPASTWTPMPELSEAEAAPIQLGGDPVTGAKLASWGRRAGGWLIDATVYVCVISAAFLWSATTEDSLTGESSDLADVVTSITLFFGPTLYQWLMIGRWGQTLGKMAVGIRVVRGEDADRVSYLRSLGRAASVWLMGILLLPLFLAYLWPLWDRRNQTIYDKMAGTIVVTKG